MHAVRDLASVLSPFRRLLLAAPARRGSAGCAFAGGTLRKMGCVPPRLIFIV